MRRGRSTTWTTKGTVYRLYKKANGTVTRTVLRRVMRRVRQPVKRAAVGLGALGKITKAKLRTMSVSQLKRLRAALVQRIASLRRRRHFGGVGGDPKSRDRAAPLINHVTGRLQSRDRITAAQQEGFVEFPKQQRPPLALDVASMRKFLARQGAGRKLTTRSVAFPRHRHPQR